jgi:hypothetical protein
VAFEQEMAAVEQADLGAGRVCGAEDRVVAARNMNELAGKPCSRTTAGASLAPTSR